MVYVPTYFCFSVVRVPYSRGAGLCHPSLGRADTLIGCTAQSALLTRKVPFLAGNFMIQIVVVFHRTPPLCGALSSQYLLIVVSDVA